MSLHPVATGIHHPMRALHLVGITVVAAFLISASGCSKNPGPQAQAGPPPHVTDLGAVELVPETPKQFDLGSGKVCTLVASPLTNGIEVEVTVMTTNANGSIQHWMSRVKTLPGRECSVSMGDFGVGLTPTLK